MKIANEWFHFLLFFQVSGVMFHVGKVYHRVVRLSNNKINFISYYFCVRRTSAKQNRKSRNISEARVANLSREKREPEIWPPKGQGTSLPLSPCTTRERRDGTSGDQGVGMSLREHTWLMAGRGWHLWGGAKVTLLPKPLEPQCFFKGGAKI